MKIIPSDTLEIVTSLTIKEVKDILDNNIQPKVKFDFSFSNKHKVFEGFLKQDSFEIQRIIRGRNSFIPQIKGKIKSNNNGSTLMVDLKMNQFVIVFVIIWLGITGVSFFVSLFAVFNQGLNPIAAIGPAVMIAFAFGLMNYGYNSEKKKAIEALEKILKGKMHSAF